MKALESLNDEKFAQFEESALNDMKQFAGGLKVISTYSTSSGSPCDTHDPATDTNTSVDWTNGSC